MNGSNFKVHYVPMLRDNYSYFLVDSARQETLIIDPAEAQPSLDFLESQKLSPVGIWLTHHHQDHIGGLDGLLARHANLPVLCSERDRSRIPQATRSVRDNECLEFAGEQVRVLNVPGHAEGHIAFHFFDSGHLFSGDVIFGASCGAVFGDTYEEMCDSVTRLSQLPAETKIWCGHEYTTNNLRFAESVLGREALASRQAEHRVPSIPLLLRTERSTNPFMRLETEEVRAYVGKTERYEVFEALRKAKDQF